MRRNFASALFAALLLAGVAGAVSGCNTARGIGEDMSAAGHAVSNSADKVQSGE